MLVSTACMVSGSSRALWSERTRALGVWVYKRVDAGENGVNGSVWEGTRCHEDLMLL